MKNKLLCATVLAIVLLSFTSCTEKITIIPVTGVSLNQVSLSMTEGETAALEATVSPYDATNKAVVWSSSNTTVASVSNGQVTALSAGSASISVTTQDGAKSAVCSVTVKPRVVSVSSVALDKTAATLMVGETVTLTATVTPDDATYKTVTWSTSDASVATVKDGVVTAVKHGTAAIMASAGDKTATCTITVKSDVGNGTEDVGEGGNYGWNQ